MNLRSGLARTLGGPAARRRRHRRALAAGVVLLVVAALLVVFGGEESSSFRAAADETCATFSARVARERDLSFPEGAPTVDAQAEYLSHAFADTMDELVAALRALDPPGDAVVAIDLLAARIDALRADPSIGVGADPFAAEVEPALDAAGLEACGSGF